MRIGVILLVLSIFPLSACASNPVAHISAEVNNEEGKPVEGARVLAYFKKDDRLIGNSQRSDVTDTDGKAEVYGVVPDIVVDLRVKKDGYYLSSRKVNIVGDGTDLGANVTLVIREKINPVSMYAKKVSVRLPETNRKIGFDFFEGGLVYEGESGVDSDIYIKAERPVFKGPFDEFEQIVTISAGSEKGGVMFFKPPEAAEHSEFKSHHEAPGSGYHEKVVVRSWRNPDEGVKFENRNRPAYVRIRTETDENGNIEIAHYCKIFPGFTPVGVEKAGVSFTYYCNPHPNDRGMEYKLKHSLVPGADEHNRPRMP